MVLAQRIQLNILDQNDLARIRFENRIVNDLIEVLPIALRKKFQGACRPVGCTSQAFSIKIFADPAKQFAICFRDSVELLSS